MVRKTCYMVAHMWHCSQVFESASGLFWERPFTFCSMFFFSKISWNIYWTDASPICMICLSYLRQATSPSKYQHLSTSFHYVTSSWWLLDSISLFWTKDRCLFCYFSLAFALTSTTKITVAFQPCVSWSSAYQPCALMYARTAMRPHIHFHASAQMSYFAAAIYRHE